MKPVRLIRAVAHAHGVHEYTAKGRHIAIRYNGTLGGISPDFTPRPRVEFHAPAIFTPVLPPGFRL